LSLSFKIIPKAFLIYSFSNNVFLISLINFSAVDPISEVHKEIWRDIENAIIGDGADQIGRILPRGTGKSVFG
ncbi:hypothetical protein LAV60_20980, partial [Clostridium sporogenes]|nr:hypothetical protein [Clostridium sporogenes]